MAETPGAFAGVLRELRAGSRLTQQELAETAFAVHAAHRLASRFPGGQVFLPLHGHTPGRAPVDPADALASLLLAVEVPPGRSRPA